MSGHSRMFSRAWILPSVVVYLVIEGETVNTNWAGFSVPSETQTPSTPSPATSARQAIRTSSPTLPWRFDEYRKIE
jgi:hypothetical protein